MLLNSINQKIDEEKCVGLRYQVPRSLPFRDRVTFYNDGKILFERFCYGESAGHIFSMWGTANTDDLIWDYASCPNTKATQAPKNLCHMDGDAIYFDDKLKTPWTLVDTLKTDPENGYGKLNFFKKLFKK